MCGVAGYLIEDAAAPLLRPERRLADMVGVLGHRGPDHQGCWGTDRAGLACARLAVIDPSPAGHQPLTDADGAVRLVCNGEIYNFLELRRELTALGHNFRGGSDTEVVVHGFSQWGPAVFARLRGMFAIALWDAVGRRLYLVRDRIGKKPLYYGALDGTMIFGSEIKSVLTWPSFARRPNLEAVHHYLSLQYVPSPWTAFEGIESLLPGHYLECTGDGTRRLVGYASAPAPVRAGRPSGQLQEELAAHLDNAVRDRMHADVPIGAFLSGGVDSSSIVALMAKHGAGRVKTFSAGFAETGHDERHFARLVAERFATDHHDYLLRPDVAALVPRLVWHYGQPFADSSAVPTFCLAELARRHVTVVLTGDGGDELFLGYDRYAEIHAARWIERLPGMLRRFAGFATDRMSPGLESLRAARVMRRLLGRLDARNSRRYAPRMAFFSDLAKRQGYGPRLAPVMANSSLDLWEHHFKAEPDMLSGAARADFNTYLPDDLLVKTDVATMAHGLEARAPLLDERLVDWTMTVPANERFRAGEPKALFKAAMSKTVPREILDRPKMGFRAPLKSWVDGPLREFVGDTLRSRGFVERGLFDPAFVERLMVEHYSGTMDHHPRLWALLVMEQWFQMWIDTAAVPREAPSFTLSA